ncbi:MAG: DUF4255 domain-containing protein [Gammaproteobacteria bacterium]|nr:DUF4255 domain-containing protein [Gammaproteobacteria bacterium]
MSDSTAIAMVGESLRTLLLDEMDITPSADVTLLAPDEHGATRRVNLFLYKIQENVFFRNKEWEVSRTNAGQITPPPLSLNLHYLMTAYAQNDQETGNTTAHEVMGEAMRVLNQFPVVPSTYLATGLADAREQIKITHISIDFEELSKIWSTFNEPFRLSVAYEISVVQIDQSADTARDLPTRVTSIGKPDVLAHMSLPVITEVQPLSGPVGTVVQFSGDYLDGRFAYVTMSGRQVMNGVVISGNSFSMAVPAGLQAGFHQLRVDVSKLYRRTYYFEVT